MEFLRKLLGTSSGTFTLDHIELHEWFEAQAPNILDVQEKVEHILEEIEDTKQTILDELESLEEIDDESYKKYVKATKAFVGSFDPVIDYANLTAMAKSIEEDITAYKKKVSKHYYAVQAHLPDIAVIDAAVNSLEQLILQFHDIARKEEVRLYKSLLARIRQLNEKVIKYEELQEKAKSLHSELQLLQSKEATLQKKIDNLKQSNEFKQIAKTQAKLEAVERDMDKLNRKLKKAFAPLDGLLPDEAKEYLETPSKALAGDEGFRIIDILAQIKKRHPDVKHRLDAKYLEKARHDFQKFKSEKKELHTLLEKVSIVMDYKELTYQLEHAKEKTKAIKKDIDEIRYQMDELSLSQKKRELQQDLTSFSGQSVTIS